jgi:AcrR family transcriptional regulator
VPTKPTAKRSSTTDSTEPTSDAPIKRRRRGEAKAALLIAARDLFNERGYADTSTREIAERAAVSETLMFRYFGTKAGVFSEAMVQPFVEFVQAFAKRFADGAFDSEDDEAATRDFVGGLYDVFHQHRGLVAMFFAADSALSSELAESGVLADVADQLQTLVELGRTETRARHDQELPQQDLTTRATLAMVAGMAAFGPSFYGRRRPSRKAIVEELAQSILHGHDRQLR